MSGKYQIFYPGQYLEWEKKFIEERFELVAKGVPKERRGPELVHEYELLKFNHNWDPYNPLFNNREYAQKAGYKDVPAWPCFKVPMGGAMMLAIPQDIADIWFFGHGPDDVELIAPIYPGDLLYTEIDKLYFEDITVPGSDLRHFRFGSTASMYNQHGELVVRATGWLRNAYRKIIDGSPAPSLVEQMADTMKDYPPAHFTTDEEWEYIKELWRKEHIRGGEKLYWEDVKIGDEPAWTCSGPVSYFDMVGWYGGTHMDLRDAIMKGGRGLFKDRYGQYLFGTAAMVGGRNIPGSRAVFYNDTGAKLVTRMVTNYIGDAGFVTRVGWMFQQSYKEMRYPREGGEYLDKVPYMKGKACTVHGSEGDCVIAKGYVTDKYVNDRGEHIVDLVCWGETLDRRIIEVVPVSVRLPSKTG